MMFVLSTKITVARYKVRHNCRIIIERAIGSARRLLKYIAEDSSAGIDGVSVDVRAGKTIELLALQVLENRR